VSGLPPRRRVAGNSGAAAIVFSLRQLVALRHKPTRQSSQ
jgi:hypothetical protein